MKDSVTVYLTHRALSSGIIEAEAVVKDGISVVGAWYGNGVTVLRKPDWHLTKEEAVKQASKMRTDKIKTLQKQISKLNAIKFEL